MKIKLTTDVLNDLIYAFEEIRDAIGSGTVLDDLYSLPGWNSCWKKVEVPNGVSYFFRPIGYNDEGKIVLVRDPRGEWTLHIIEME